MTPTNQAVKIAELIMQTIAHSNEECIVTFMTLLEFNALNVLCDPCCTEVTTVKDLRALAEFAKGKK